MQGPKTGQLKDIKPLLSKYRNGVEAEEASTLRWPPGFWPTDKKCKCGSNSPRVAFAREGSDLVGWEVLYADYYCDNCDQVFRVYNW